MKQKRAKWPWVLLMFFGLSVGVFACRHVLIATVLERALAYVSHEKLHYQHRQIHGNEIRYENVRLGEGIAAQHAVIDWNWQFFPFYLEPKVDIEGARLKINPEENNTALAALLLPTKYFGVRLNVSGGQIFIHGKEQPSAFSFCAGETREEIGKLHISNTIVAEVRQTAEGMQVRGSMHDIDICDAGDLLVRFFQMPHLTAIKMGGVLRLDGQIAIDHQFTVQSLKADLSIENAVWERGDRAFNARHLQLILHYPSGEHGALWQQMLAAAAWEEGHVRLQKMNAPLFLHSARGHIYLSPQEEPLFEMEGRIGDGLSFTVEGKGVLEEGQVPWLEMRLKAEESLATVAVKCSDWDIFPVKIDLENWKGAALRETLKAMSYFMPELEDVQAVQGTVLGRIESRIEKGTIPYIEWHNLSMRDLYFEIPKMQFQGFLGAASSNGSFIGNQIHQCELSLSQGLLSYNKKRLEDFQGVLKVVDGNIEPSTFTCKIEGVKSDIKVEGRLDALRLQAALEAPLRIWAELLHQSVPDPYEKILHVDLSGIFHDGRLDTTGSFKTDMDRGEFGLGLDKEQRVEHGWFTIPRATKGLYAPFLKGALADGELSIRGKIQGPHVEGHFTIDHPSLTIPEACLSASQLDEGRFSWNAATGAWQGGFLLRDGELSQASLEIKGLEGEFTFTENCISGNNISCAWDGLAFLGDMQLLFVKEGEWDLRLTSQMAEGDLNKILPHLSLPSGISGKFYSEREGLQCRIHHSVEGTDYFWRVKTNLREVGFGLLQEGTGLLEYDSEAQMAVVSQFQAKAGGWVIKSAAAKLENIPTKPLEFDVEISRKGHPGLKLSGKGHLPPDNQYRLELSADNARWLKCMFTDSGIVWDLAWHTMRANGSIANQSYSISSLAAEEMPGIIFSTPTPLIWDGSGCRDILLIAKEGEKVVGRLSAPLAQMQKESVEIPEAQLAWQEFNLPLHIRLTASQAHLKTAGDALRISWDKELKCQGTLHGLSLDVARKDIGFAGRVKIEDGVRLSAFSKTSFLKEMNGLELEGAWKKEPAGWHFAGKVQGDEVTLKGCQLHQLKGDMTITPKAVVISNLQIEDPAGQFSLKQISIRKSITGSWDTDIPLVKGHHFKPSLLRTADGKPSKEKPFEIRSLVLTDLFCEGDDILQLRGKGSFHFTNREKKESSIFDIPLKMMKDLGLDFDLFRPESGDVKCLFREGRIYITELENSFSEGRRSQFFLASDFEPSYIDWQGKLHLNLRMKQDAALKLGEPFALTVRGTADKPSYGLR